MTVADELDLRAGIEVEADDVMILRQARRDRAANRARRASDQNPHDPPRSIASLSIAH
jgi:hypothetical protein